MLMIDMLMGGGHSSKRNLHENISSHRSPVNSKTQHFIWRKISQIFMLKLRERAHKLQSLLLNVPAPEQANLSHQTLKVHFPLIAHALAFIHLQFYVIQ